ncbi:hypothetical protein H4582DRAFT_1927950 [Lactarius indigo]|nr:hypothetical protein H4582DRAFT_1927950 [Lactarius indigo]
MALERDHSEVVQQLLERGANIHAKNYHGNTALRVAETRGNQDMVQLLLQYGTKGS